MKEQRGRRNGWEKRRKETKERLVQLENEGMEEGNVKKRDNSERERNRVQVGYVEKVSGRESRKITWMKGRNM